MGLIHEEVQSYAVMHWSCEQSESLAGWCSRGAAGGQPLQKDLAGGGRPQER